MSKEEKTVTVIQKADKHWTKIIAVLGALAFILIFSSTIVKEKLTYSDGKIAQYYQDNRHVKHKELDTELEDIQLTLLRIEILNIYNTYKDSQEIPSIVMESYCEIYDEYISKGGNHYIKDVIDPEIRTWNIVKE